MQAFRPAPPPPAGTATSLLTRRQAFWAAPVHVGAAPIGLPNGRADPTRAILASRRKGEAAPRLKVELPASYTNIGPRDSCVSLGAAQRLAPAAPRASSAPPAQSLLAEEERLRRRQRLTEQREAREAQLEAQRAAERLLVQARWRALMEDGTAELEHSLADAAAAVPLQPAGGEAASVGGGGAKAALPPFAPPFRPSASALVVTRCSSGLLAAAATPRGKRIT